LLVEDDAPVELVQHRLDAAHGVDLTQLSQRNLYLLFGVILPERHLAPLTNRHRVRVRFSFSRLSRKITI
jgi:hypothetical protein